MRAQPVPENKPTGAVVPGVIPMPVATQPTVPSVTGTSASPGAPSINFAPQITINAPTGSDPQALADLLDSRLRSLIRDAMRGSSAAMHD
jgi:hypothetical protein